MTSYCKWPTVYLVFLRGKCRKGMQPLTADYRKLKTRRTCTIYFVAQTIERWLFYRVGFEVAYFDAIFYPSRKPDN